MQAVMYGAGNIGRGFIGALFSQAGYTVGFVDVVDQVVHTLQKDKSYPVRVVSSDGYEDMEITGVDAIHGNDTHAVAAAIASADIMATAVGVGALKFIIPNLVAGFQLRFSQTDRPLDMIICENLMDANIIVEKMIKVHLSEDEKALFDQRIGLVEASIGRMVPVQTSQMQDGNPLRVCVEQYNYLPVDKAAFKGPIPDIPQLIPVSPFSFYIKRKLFLHNMGHALCAYLGKYQGLKYIYQSIGDPHIGMIVKNAMLESAEGISLAYGFDFMPLLKHIEDLLYRFSNQALADTCARVGQDARRKLASTDRLVGAAQLCMEQGVYPSHIVTGIAGALYYLMQEEDINHDRQKAGQLLESISGLSHHNPLTSMVLDMYGLYTEGATPDEMRKAAEKQKHIHQKAVV